MRVVLVGGGTGGHFYPLIAVAETLNTQKTGAGNAIELYYLGPDKYDETVLHEQEIKFVYCPAGKARRYFSILNIVDFFKTFVGLFVAIYKLFVIYPDVIFTKGSAHSVPIVIAGWLLRIPIVVHESDVKPGRANKIAGHVARYIAISYAEAAEHFSEEKIALTGIPMRRVLLQPPTTSLRQTFGIDAEPIILVLGGSQGAERVNALIIDTLDELLPKFHIIHQVGKDHMNATVEAARALITDETLFSRYHPFPFLDANTLNTALHEAVIVISRAGSTSIHEAAIHGKPSILIPIPEDVSHDQRSNAYAYARTGAATVLEEQNLRDGLLEAEILRIMSDQELYQKMSEAARAFAPTNAAESIAAALVQIGNEHE